MTKIDQFESLFRAASKSVFEPEPVDIRDILIVTDMDEQRTNQFVDQARAFLTALDVPEPVRYSQVCGDEFDSVQQMLDRLENPRPDLVVTYRNLHAETADHPFSLGAYINVLTQATEIPTLLLPEPKVLASTEPSPLADGTRHVMVVTDHLAGDHHLVSMAIRFVADDGDLILSHIEDQKAFDRYMKAIEKIPDLDSDVARQTISQQLLAEPRDYIESCRSVLQARGVQNSIKPLVTFGNRIEDYRHLIEDRHIDLLVMNSRDDDQLAMHGVAYPLVVELRKTPILLV
jgi:nucleotide-binding universal stress UspA family protein